MDVGAATGPVEKVLRLENKEGVAHASINYCADGCFLDSKVCVGCLRREAHS